MTPRRRAVVGSACAAAVLLVAVGVVWWLQPFSDLARTGDAVDLAGQVTSGSDDLPLARTAVVITPSGAVEVSIGEPVDAVRRAAPSADLRAPRGSSFVPVQWSQLGPAPVPVARLGTPSEAAAVWADLEPTLAVVAPDGVASDDYPLGPPGGSEDLPETRAVALLVDDPDDVRVEVTFDGLTQVVDAATGEVDAGVAQLYYDDAEAAAAAGSTAEPTGATEVACTWEGALPRVVARDDAAFFCDDVAARRAPWRPGGGWVDVADRVWVGVEVTAFADRVVIPSSRTYFRTSGGVGTPTLDGAGPVDAEYGAGPFSATVGRVVDAAVWQVGVDQTQVEVELPASLVLTEDDPDGGGDPGDPDVLRLDRTVRVSATFAG